MMLNEKRRGQNLNAVNRMGAALSQANQTTGQISQTARVVEFGKLVDNAADSARLQLPNLATANDVREVVQFLKQRPNGVNVCDIVQPIKKRVFYPAKIEAYLSWGLVTKKGERLKLTTLGWEFAKSLEPEARAYRRLLKSTVLYEAALRWISDQEMDLVNKDELLEFWESAFSKVGRDASHGDPEKGVVSFFHLCQAAELGTFTIGKRGQPARLRIWSAALSEFLNVSSTKQRLAEYDPERLRLVIPNAYGTDLIEQVRRVLKQGGFEVELAEECSCQQLGLESVRLTVCSQPDK